MKQNNYQKRQENSAISFPAVNPPCIQFRPYQRRAFENKTSGIEVWLWARQTGKSFTLAAWAVDRLISRPGRLVTILSNSKTNGMELNAQCAKVCRLMGQAFEFEDLSADNRFETMNCETRIRINGEVGRIKVLAANPRTARGFSGDLILDEFAFHENASAIWEAAEPILAANQDYLCRIASTPNGKHNLFYRFCTDPSVPLLKVTRTDAYAQGLEIYHPHTREKIDPATARNLARNKRAYDQNYECVFDDDNMVLLTNELINAAERPGVGVVCENEWSNEALALLKSPLFATPGRKSLNQWIEQASDPEAMKRHIFFNVSNGSNRRYHELMQSDIPFSMNDIFDDELWRDRLDQGRQLFAGVDVGRNKDRTVITVVERSANLFIIRAILRIDQTRLPEQQRRLETILNIPAVRLLKMDATGIGLGLFEYTQQKFPERVVGINFATSVPLEQHRMNDSGVKTSVRFTEYLAVQLLQAYEDRVIHQPIDNCLRDDLRKPERLLTPSGHVSIAATRDEAGHADHFWSLALAIDAAKTPIPQPFTWVSFTPRARLRCTTL